ncbi:MAG: Uma2 family endonuclease [Microcoleus sp.]
MTIKTSTKEGTEQGRVPDVSVIDRTLWRAERKSYTAPESPIQLAVEVVSTNWEDDYVDQLDEYERFLLNTGLLIIWQLVKESIWETRQFRRYLCFR